MKIAQRTFTPFDNRGDRDMASLSPATQKSVQPFNNVPTIQDILNGTTKITDVYPHAGGDWSPGEDVDKSYKEKGDEYKREVRDEDIINKMLDRGERQQQQWKLKIPGGSKLFMSFDLARQYLRNRNLPFSYVSRIAQKTPNDETKRISVIAEAITKVFMVEAIDFQKGVKETGSAFCVYPTYFITCAHAIRKYNKRDNVGEEFFKGATINLVHEGMRHNAVLMAIDSQKDMALLKCNIDIEPLALDSETVAGHDIIAIGSPQGYENNVSEGIVGSLNRQVYFHAGAPKYMFVDLAVFPGNSGGPVIKTDNGAVAGMVSLIVSSSGTYGLNAALPSSYIIDFCKRNIKGF
jgi:S1-C subfamily serine protease